MSGSTCQPLPLLPQIGDRNGELTARMNVAQLQLALGRLGSPAAAEKPDLAGYEAQGECPGLGIQPSSGRAATRLRAHPTTGAISRQPCLEGWGCSPVEAGQCPCPVIREADSKG